MRIAFVCFAALLLFATSRVDSSKRAISSDEKLASLMEAGLEDTVKQRSVDDKDDREENEIFKRVLKNGRKRRRFRNCRQLKAAGIRKSGLYKIRTNIGIIQVYCEMTIAGGTFTFLPRSAIMKSRKLNLRHILTKAKDKVLLRFQATDTTQPYTLVEQLPAYAQIPLFAGVNNNDDYKTPMNSVELNETYVYLGFLPKSQANNTDTQGFRTNGQDLTFKNCNATPNSYFAFFPNHFEETPSTYGAGWNLFSLTNRWVQSGMQPYSHRTMPNEYFFFAEMHFGGCGAYWQSNRRFTTFQGAYDYSQQIEGVAVGF